MNHNIFPGFDCIYLFNTPTTSRKKHDDKFDMKDLKHYDDGFEKL